MKKLLASSLLALSIGGTVHADAFCGFYVSGADASLFADATQVVLMRDGTRTVLSMQNDYKGPPADFALVVPVPVVLQKENVKTLSADVFKRIDTLSAPRLVEYWEQDPCAVGIGLGNIGSLGYGAGIGGGAGIGSGRGAPEPLVKVEAQFEVGEYDIVILSAKDSSALDTWLRENHYKIPAGAAAALAPYVQAGSKFFVAKVDVAKVKMEDGRATLSPLRFHYDSEKFELPVKLGLLNSAGTQDLIVNILATERYEAASHPNVTIPTNLDVNEAARAKFGTFYAALFDRTIAEHPGAVVTEYAWQSTKCDPCPGDLQGMSGNDLASLGADVMPTMTVTATRSTTPPVMKLGAPTVTGALPVEVVTRIMRQNVGRVRVCYEAGLRANAALAGHVSVKLKVDAAGSVQSVDDAGSAMSDRTVVACITRAMNGLSFPEPADKKPVVITQPIDLRPPEKSSSAPTVNVTVANASHGLTLTRLHARYGKDAIGNDLVFRLADPIEGGREAWASATIDTGTTKLKAGDTSAFQARYAIRHPWTGKVECAQPQRGVWGARPIEDAGGVANGGAMAATKLAYVPRNGDLASFTNVSFSVIDGAMGIRDNGNANGAIVADAGGNGRDATTDPAPTPKKSACGCHVVGRSEGGLALVGIALACMAFGRRRSARS